MSTGSPPPVSGEPVADDEAWADARGFQVGADNVLVIDAIDDVDDATLVLRRGLAAPAIARIMAAPLPVAVRVPWTAVAVLLPALRAADSAHRPFRYDVNPPALPTTEVDLR
jgi:hypothetical protein